MVGKANGKQNSSVSQISIIPAEAWGKDGGRSVQPEEITTTGNQNLF